jgi:hypothetical protein
MTELLRIHLSDEQKIGWPKDDELLAFLDRAADYLSGRLIADRDTAMLAALAVDGETPLPADFVSFAGNAPVSVMNGVCTPYLDYGFSVNYWAKMPHPSAWGWETPVPYGRERALLIADIARLFALNRNEYDISQDLTLLGEARSAMKGAKA